MTVTVRYAAQARTAAGQESERVELVEGASVQDLLKSLADRYGNGVFLHPSTLVFVGDEQAGRRQSLQSGEEVTVLTPISGG